MNPETERPRMLNLKEAEEKIEISGDSTYPFSTAAATYAIESAKGSKHGWHDFKCGACIDFYAVRAHAFDQGNMYGRKQA